LGAQAGRPDRLAPGGAAGDLLPQHQRGGGPLGHHLGAFRGRPQGAGVMSRWLLFSVALTAAALAASLVVYFGYHECLPDRVAVHWNLQGKPDGFVPRDAALPYLLIGPGVMALMVVLTVVLPRISPAQFGVNRFRPTYDYLMALVVGLFAYIS